MITRLREQRELAERRVQNLLIQQEKVLKARAQQEQVKFDARLAKLRKQQEEKKDNEDKRVRRVDQRLDDTDTRKLAAKRYYGPKPILQPRVVVERTEEEKEAGRKKQSEYEPLIGKSFRHPETSDEYQEAAIPEDRLMYQVEGVNGIAALVKKYDLYAGLEEKQAWPTNEKEMGCMV